MSQHRTHRPLDPAQLRQAGWVIWTGGLIVSVMLALAGLKVAAALALVVTQLVVAPTWLAYGRAVRRRRQFEDAFYA